MEIQLINEKILNDPLYSLYKICLKQTHQSYAINYFDKKFKLSGLLSYLISHNWSSNNEIIELVNTEQLWEYKEIDRTINSKVISKDPIEVMNKKCSSILNLFYFSCFLSVFPSFLF